MFKSIRFVFTSILFVSTSMPFVLAQANSPAAAVEVRREDNALLPIPGAVLYNNVYGKGNITNYRQSVRTLGVQDSLPRYSRSSAAPGSHGSPADLDGGYSGPLFSGAQPSSVGFTEQSAFRHYLYALRQQVLRAAQTTFDDAVDGHRRTLDDAETTLRTLGSAGIRGQQRDFTAMLDVNRAALELFVSLRGPMLRREWGNI
jgi:hypothetical protein